MSRNMQMASDMGARGRVEMQDATFIAIGRFGEILHAATFSLK
jgi:hypothetical protein